MKQHHKIHLISCFALLLAFLSGSICHAKWARPDLNAPVDRLITNIEAYIKKNPKDAQGYYTLGRLHSLAFAKGMGDVALYSDREDKENRLPTFPAFESILVKRDDSKVDALKEDALKHFHESVRNYRLATQLKPTDKEDEYSRRGLYSLGLGWMLEQGHLLGKKAGPPPGANAKGEPSWRVQALEAYRTAFRLGAPEDLKSSAQFLGSDNITLKSAEGIERLQKGRSLSVKEQEELKKMREAAKTIRAKPRMVTPIVFPLDENIALRQMISQQTVRFDLAGDDIKRRWPWVKPNVGILVWDPEKKGKITSGRQLFGSVTWWMFWKDGYQPLAALDNNQDGGLTGTELEGIAVWRDANGNGISDPGEVIPARKFGIKRIAVQADGRQDDALSNSTGIELLNGKTLPTFDWTPTGQPLK